MDSSRPGMSKREGTKGTLTFFFLSACVVIMGTVFLNGRASRNEMLCCDCDREEVPTTSKKHTVVHTWT